MSQKKNIRPTARVGYQHQFRWSYLLPKYWGVWLATACLLILAFIPYRIRDIFSAKFGNLAGKIAKKQRHRARINLQHCFPQWNEKKVEQVIDNMFVVLAQVMLSIGELAIRSKKYLHQRSEFIGMEYINDARNAKKNILLLVPHGWAVDASGTILYSHGMSTSAMYNPHRNLLVDWLWNKTRIRFGGKMYPRQNGIKPFLSAVKGGEIGYYLPDEDFGAEASVFVDFFATYKATLPGLNKMAKIANAVVIPMFPRYNARLGKYQIEIHPPLALSEDDEQSARAMNSEIESFVTPEPEQYAWILRFLKTRKNGEDIYQ